MESKVHLQTSVLESGCSQEDSNHNAPKRAIVAHTRQSLKNSLKNTINWVFVIIWGSLTFVLLITHKTIAMAWNVSLDYAKKLADRWENDEIPASDYYYRQARKMLRIFGDFLSTEKYNSLVGLIEFYNHHR